LALNIVCTAKPCDGLLYYSYEYCSYLNSIGTDAHLIIISHPFFSEEDYFNSITEKYTIYENVIVDDIAYDGITLIMGRSMMTLGYKDRESYTIDQLLLMHMLFRDKVLVVYSENHPVEYSQALDYFCPREVVDLCDYAVYSKGVGKPFEKRIWFDIYKPLEKDVQFKYLFNGTNSQYYNAAKKVIHKYPDHGIMIYDIGVINSRYNNLIVPITNLLGVFDTYVYTKSILDPAPRIIQECIYYKKDMIFEYTNKGAEVYRNRKIQKPDVENIINEL
jgi:hypothetical protein